MKRLQDLEVGEVSFVPEGANKRKFLVYKSKSGGPMASPQEALQKLLKADPAVMQKVDGVLKAHFTPGKPGAPEAPAKPAPAPTPEPKAAATPGEISPEEAEQAKHALKAIVRIITPWKDKLSPILLHEVLDAAGFEATVGSDDGEEADPAEGADPAAAMPVGKDDGAVNVGDGHPVVGAHASGKDPAVEEEVGKMTGGYALPEKIESEEKDVLEKMGIKKESMDGAKEVAKAAYKAHMEKLGHREYPDAELQMKSVHKNKEEEGGHVSKTAVAKSANGALDLSMVPVAARPMVEAIYKGHQELVLKNAALEAKLEQRDASDRKRELIQKAASYQHIGLKMDDVVATLEDAAKAGPEALERITKQFDTLNEQARTSKVFAEYGSSQSAPMSGGAEAKIDAAVSSIVQKSSGATSKEQAYEAFIRTTEGQRLYAEFKSGRKDGI